MKYLFPIFLLASSLAAQELPFTHYTPEKEVNPLPSSAVMMTLQDRAGYIWFVVYSSGLVRYNGTSMDLFTVADGLPGVDVRFLLEDHYGRLWVTTEAGLAVSTKPLDEYTAGDRISFTNRVGDVPLYPYSVIENRICEGPNGDVWVGTRTDGIIRYAMSQDGLLSSDTLKTGLKASTENLDVRSMTVRREGTVWVSLGGGSLGTYEASGRRRQLMTPTKS